MVAYAKCKCGLTPSGASHPDVESGERTDGDDGDEDEEHVDGGEHAQDHVARRHDAHGQRHAQADERPRQGPALDLLQDGQTRQL